MKWTLLLLILTVSCKMPWAEDEFATSDLAGDWTYTDPEDPDFESFPVFNNAGTTLIHWYDIDGADLFDFVEVTSSSSVSSGGNVAIVVTLTPDQVENEWITLDMTGPMNTSKSQVTLSVTQDYYVDGYLINSASWPMLLGR